MVEEYELTPEGLIVQREHYRRLRNQIEWQD